MMDETGVSLDIEVISYGKGHPEPAPRADITFDTSDWFRDPHVSPAMRNMTGKDPEVIFSVLEDSGGKAAIAPLLHMVEMLMEHGDDVDRPIVIAICCVGGRHRSVAIADALARQANADGYLTSVTHRDLDKPVIARPVSNGNVE